MVTKIVWPWELPKYIDGIAIVCDVWASTTNINTLLNANVGKLLIVNIDNIQSVREKYQNSLIAGQSLKLPKTFFDTSNLPTDIAKLKAKGKTVLYMSSNGTRVIELAFKKKAHKILTVSFSNIKSVVSYIKKFDEKIYLIPSGEVEATDPKVLEDLICVQSLDSLLRGKEVDIEKSKRIAKAYIIKYYGNQGFDQETNFRIVFDTNNLDIVPMCTKEAGSIIVRNVFNN